MYKAKQNKLFDYCYIKFETRFGRAEFFIYSFFFLSDVSRGSVGFSKVFIYCGRSEFVIFVHVHNTHFCIRVLCIL